MPTDTLLKLQATLDEKECEIQNLLARCEQQAIAIQQLEEKQFYYENILAHVPSHVYWLNKDNVYLGCNDAHAKTVGLSSRHEIVGKTNFDMPWREQADLMNILNQSVISTGIPQSQEEYTNINNVLRTYISQKTPLKNKSNEIIGVLGISIEITERKQLEESLRQAKDAAEAANHAKTEFLANMRHDIRTPLSGIIGFSELLKLEFTEPRINEYADNLVASSHALLNLMDEVLEAVRVSSGEIPMLKRKFNLTQTLEQVIALYLAHACGKNIKLSLILDESLPHYVIGDKIRVHRIALELIGNALNFTDVGHVTIKVTLAKKENNQLVIKMTVTDSGMGIPKDKQQEIYLQFKRLTPSYQGIYKGAGLGLYIVKQFIDDLNGEIYVESELQKGTCFTCLIPLQQPLINDSSGIDEDEELKSEQSFMMPLTHQLNRSFPNLKTKSFEATIHVLVVEDNHIAQTVAHALLSQLSCVVDIASTGLDALNLCEKNQYDLIFMDIGLGEGMNGYEVTHHIRNQFNKMRNTPIIALTAHAGNDNKQRCIEAGMDAVLTKPLTQAHATDILKTFIPAKRAETPITSTAPKRRDLPDHDDELFQLEQFVLLDSDEALKNFGNNQAMLIEMLTLMINQEVTADLDTMKNAFAAHDYSLVEKIAHKIKGGAVYVGTTRMKYACQYVERYLKAGESGLFDKLVHQAIKTIEETLAHIEVWLQQCDASEN
ncbi:response regulator [uncultured Legionella sp.]|uniref:response regulator n=1 Tax=uncultured Legionella sp. TaxID=210934 RepID=UPI00260872A2|nr:response regulator [uncultured Legionella sp.]